MNVRRITKLVVLCLTIWVADLIKENIIQFLDHEKNYAKPIQTTMIMMFISVAVFYPLLTVVDAAINKGMEKYVSNVKKASGSALMGVFIAFVVGFLVLLTLYVQFYYKVWPWQVL